jgi:hypothetical protein
VNWVPRLPGPACDRDWNRESVATPGVPPATRRQVDLYLDDLRFRCGGCHRAEPTEKAQHGGVRGKVWRGQAVDARGTSPLCDLLQAGSRCRPPPGVGHCHRHLRRRGIRKPDITRDPGDSPVDCHRGQASWSRWSSWASCERFRSSTIATLPRNAHAASRAPVRRTARRPPRHPRWPAAELQMRSHREGCQHAVLGCDLRRLAPDRSWP